MPTQEIDQAQTQIVNAFAIFDDWMERYQYLIDLGKKLPTFPEDRQVEAHRLHGCQSQVWFYSTREEGRLHFHAISDSTIVSGLIALLLKIYSGRYPDDILATKPDFIDNIGLSKHLSPTRKNGLHALLQAIYQHAKLASDGPDSDQTLSA